MVVMNSGMHFPKKGERRGSAPITELSFHCHPGVPISTAPEKTSSVTKLKRFFQRRRSHCESSPSSSPLVPISSQTTGGDSPAVGTYLQIANDIFVCRRCAQDLGAGKQRPPPTLYSTGRARRVSEQEVFPDPLQNSAGNCTVDVRRSMEVTPDSGLDPPSGSIALLRSGGSAPNDSVNNERHQQAIRCTTQQPSGSQCSSRRDSGHNDMSDEVLLKFSPAPQFSTCSPHAHPLATSSPTPYLGARRTSIAERPSSRPILPEPTCTFCNCTISESELSTYDSSKNVPPFISTPSSSQSQQHGTPYQRSISLTDDSSSENNASKVLLMAYSSQPPKEPNKLRACQPNSGITFVDSKIKLAEPSRTRSNSSHGSEQRRQRTVRSHSVFGVGQQHENSHYFWPNIGNDFESNRLTKALAKENGAYTGSLQHVAQRNLSCISENSRYITLSRTPCAGQRSRSGEIERQFSEENGFATMFQHCSVYETMPESSKLLVLDSQLSVEKGYCALLNNQTNVAPVWNEQLQCFDGIFSLSDFIPIYQHFRSIHNPDQRTYQYSKNKSIGYWLDVIREYASPPVLVQPDQHLHQAVQQLREHETRYLLLIDPQTGNMLSVISPQRLVRYLSVKCYEHALRPAHQLWLQKSIDEVVTGGQLIITRVATCGTLSGKGCPFVSVNTGLDEVLNKFLIQRGNYGAAGVLPVLEMEHHRAEDCVLVDLLTESHCVKYLLSLSDPAQTITVKQCLEYTEQTKQLAKLQCRTTDPISLLLDRFCHYDVDCIAVMDLHKPRTLVGIIHLENLLQCILCEQTS